jgi:hypothetical protein
MTPRCFLLSVESSEYWIRIVRMHADNAVTIDSPFPFDSVESGARFPFRRVYVRDSFLLHR